MIFNAFERMMAFRYLRARRKEGFVSVIAGFSFLGICLSVATLVIVMSVMNGFRKELLDRILGLGGHVIITSNRPIQDYDEIVERVRTIPGVVSVQPVVEGQALTAAKGDSDGVLVRGLRLEDFYRRPALSRSIVLGALSAVGNDDAVMIGVRMAEKYDLKVGDEMTLISPQGHATAFGTVPRMRSYKIGAIFDVGLYEHDRNLVYMSLKAAQSYFRQGDAATHIEVMTENPDALQPILLALGKRLDPSLVPTDWTRRNQDFFKMLEVQRNVMLLILSLILLVAVLNIVSGLVMLVKDKGRNIAVLRTMGAGKAAVMKIFFLVGASIGVSGTALGLALGIVFCDNIENIRQIMQGMLGIDLFSADVYFLSKIPADVNPGDLAVIGGMALGVSFLATLYPSWRAARLDPVEVLRYE